ncbi:hypothetical protein K4K56_000115 [Colletotrichum sp. SAR 10_98]|nr:hypothetical protein K4K56_000115 [Colletotrichum sp. SAR 10_98]
MAFSWLFRCVAVPWVFLCKWIPVILVLDLVGTSVAVYRFILFGLILPWYTRQDLVTPPSVYHRNAGFALLVVFSACLFLLAGTLATLWIRAAQIYRGRRLPKLADFGPKACMQAWDSAFMSLRYLRTGNRPNLCVACTKEPRLLEEGPRILDRCYHCVTTKGKVIGCLPVYDHYCWWLWTAVCVYTIKPYLLVMIYVPLFHTVALAILGWSFSLPSQSSRQTLVALAVAFPLMISWVYFAPAVKQWKRLGCQNSPHREFVKYARGRSRPEWPMVIRLPDGSFKHHVTHRSPWDLGTDGNLRAALGDRLWLWPLFWVVPRYVQEYGKSEDSDLPFSRAFLEEAEAIRASCVEVELQPLPARRQHPFSSDI